MPQACLVPVPATSARQVVRRVLGLEEHVQRRQLTPCKLGPEGSLLQQPLSKEKRFHAGPKRPSVAQMGLG